MEDTVIVPLSAIDQCGLSSCSMVYGYVLDTIDEAKVRNVACRVVEKWRLLAGRIEWNAETQMYHIRVPVGEFPDNYARMAFTRAAYPHITLDIGSPVLDSSCTAFLKRPPMKYFRHPFSPDGLYAYASRRLPLVALHISVMKNCVCVGFSFSHGAFDGTGMGMIARAFDDEINGRAWNPPALQTVNMLAKAVGDTASVDMKNLSPGLRRIETNVASMGVGSVTAFLAKFLYEKVWHRVEDRTIFIGNDVVKRLVEDVKTQVSMAGKGYVSTADVLLAWVIKAAYQRELEGGVTSKTPIAIGSAVSMRPVFENSATEKSHYPHNGFAVLIIPEFLTSDLVHGTVADLAVLHRKNLEEYRSLAYLQGYYALQERLGRNVVPSTPWGVDPWVCTNQIIGRMDMLDLGTETRQFFSWLRPNMLHHGIIMNKFKDGYILEMSMRRSRWDSLAVELERLGESQKQ